MISKKMILIGFLISQYEVIQPSFKGFTIFPTLVGTSLIASYRCHQYTNRGFDDIAQQQKDLQRLYQEEMAYVNYFKNYVATYKRRKVDLSGYKSAIAFKINKLEETKQRVEQEYAERMERMPDILALLADIH